MMVAARALQRAGHRPVVVGPPDLTARVPQDVETRTIGASALPPGQLDAACGCLSSMSGWNDMKRMFETVAMMSQFYLDHLPRAVERMGAAAILHDQLEPGAGIVARGLSRSLGIRHVSLACALPMNRDRLVPPPLLGWRYRPGRFGAWLNGGYYRVVDGLLAAQNRVLEDGAQRFGLTKPAGLEDWQMRWSVDDGRSRSTDLVQGLASLDYPRVTPPNYLGPFRDDREDYPGLESIASARDGRPLAFISLGTLLGGRDKVLAAMASAAIARGLQPVVVHGGRLPDAAERLPRGTIVRDFLDQRDLLREASVAILHGGYNSTTDAVAAGVPLVIVPQAFEQGAIAARVERSGLGRSVSAFGPALSQRIDFALGDVMRSAACRRAARRARYEALAAPGAKGLLTCVEALLDRPAPPDKESAALGAVLPTHSTVIGTVTHHPAEVG